MRCRLCEGKGGWSEDFGEGTVIREECPSCNETGKIGLFCWLQWAFWDHVPEWFFEWWADTFHPETGVEVSKGTKVDLSEHYRPVDVMDYIPIDEDNK